MKNKLIDYLSGFVTERRAQLIDYIANNRTRYISLLLEDIYQPQNASAVLRTCDCLGIQDIHIVENQNKYNINPDVVVGSSNWLTIEKYNKTSFNSIEAIRTLKEKGYRIVATTPHTNDVELDNFDITKGKFVLCFGTEMNGLTPEILNVCDEYIKIPMYGFTESFNISVSAAIILHHLNRKLRNSNINWKLNVDEINEIKIDWLSKTIKKSDVIIKDFYTKINSK